MTLDDGTGVIKCVLFGFQGVEHLMSVKIGDCFQACGVISHYYYQTQIKCSVIKSVDDPHFETLWINKVLLDKKNKDL